MVLPSDSAEDCSVSYLVFSCDFIFSSVTSKLLSVIKGDSNAIKFPPNDIQLEESTANDEKTNNLIVSILNIIIIYLYFFSLEKNKWYKW